MTRQEIFGRGDRSKPLGNICQRQVGAESAEQHGVTLRVFSAQVMANGGQKKVQSVVGLVPSVFSIPSISKPRLKLTKAFPRRHFRAARGRRADTG